MFTKFNKITRIAVFTTLILGPLHVASAASYVDRAKVTHVEPVYKRVEVSKPRTECWQERVRTRRRHQHSQLHPSPAPEVIGAIIGGAVGHRLGHGHGQRAAAVAGAVIGGTIGHGVRHHQGGRGHYEPQYRMKQRCETVNDVVIERRVVAYRVTYRYHGHSYTTRMDHNPGKFIRVRIGIRPIS